MNIYSIYKIQNLINNKCYIGYTENFERRIQQHKKSHPKNSKLYNAIRCYGWDSFKCEIIYQSKDKDYCKNIMENYFILEYNSFENGYNLTMGGEGLDSKTNSEYAKITWNDDEYRIKMSNMRMQLWQTPDYREKHHKIMQDRWKNDEYRNSIIQKIHDYWSDPDNKTKHSELLKNKFNTDEIKHKRSEIAKDNWNKPGYRENQKIKQSEKWDDPNSGSYKLKGDYIVFSPDGVEYKVKGLKKFCREHGLNSKAMFDISNNKRDNYKGWKVIKL